MSVESELRELRGEIRAQRLESDNLTRMISGLVRELEQDNKLQARADEAEDEIEKRRYDALLAALEKIADTNKTVAQALEDLPDRVLDRIQKRIYDLRQAEHYARKAGVPVPYPLDPPPSPPRESTQKVLAMIEGKGEDSILPTPAQKKALSWLAKKLWSIKIHLGMGGAFGVIHWWHELGAFFRRLFGG